MNERSKYPPNPFVVVWPGQDVEEAIKAHIQQTGCRGPFFVNFMDVELLGQAPAVYKDDS